MLLCCGQVDEAFWRAYEEVRPLEPGWRERAPVLHLRERLSMIAHFGDTYGSVAPLRKVLRRF